MTDWSNESKIFTRYSCNRQLTFFYGVQAELIVVYRIVYTFFCCRIWPRPLFIAQWIVSPILPYLKGSKVRTDFLKLPHWRAFRKISNGMLISIGLSFKEEPHGFRATKLYVANHRLPHCKTYLKMNRKALLTSVATSWTKTGKIKDQKYRNGSKNWSIPWG